MSSLRSRKRSVFKGRLNFSLLDSKKRAHLLDQEVRSKIFDNNNSDEKHYSRFSGF